MAYDMLPHCPDYIKDFPDIQNLANAQGLIYNSVLIKVSGVMANACFVTKNDTWESVLGIDYSDNWQDRTFRMLRRYEYVSFEEYSKLVECFLGNSFSLTIDYESLSVVIKTTKKIYNVDKYKNALRAIFPCNMTFNMEYVTEL